MSQRHIISLLGLVSLVGLGACTSTPPSTQNTQISQPANPAATQKILADHAWQLISAQDAKGQPITALLPQKDRPVTLGFTENHLSIQGGCNLRGGSFQVTPTQRLSIGNMPATLMACSPDLMQLDQQLAALLKNPLKITLAQGDSIQLTLTAKNGEKLAFTGKPTPASLYGAPTRIFLEVAAQMAPCHDPLIPNRSCLKVREIRYDAQGLRVGQPGEWQMFYDTIEGYEHRSDTSTILRINRYTRTRTPADASTYVYVLDMIVQSSMVTPSGQQ